MIRTSATVRRAGLALVTALSFSSAACAADRVIFKKASPYTTIFVTEDERGLRAMRFDAEDGSRQSVYKLGDPEHVELAYIRSVMSGLAFADRPRSALVVGVGGGTLPMVLHRKLPKVRVDAVELDPEVINVARSHFGFREDERLRAHVADGRKFIEGKQGAYDLIILDAFGPDNIPYSLATAEFLQSVRRALTPNGIILANLWSRGSNALYDDMIRTYQHVFGGVQVIDVHGTGNRIIVANIPKPDVSSEQLLERCRRLTTELSLRYDLASVLQSGLRPTGRDGVGARVLHDADRPRK